MANTFSIHWPNMFNVSQNSMSIATDNASITNRVKLMMLTEPTELYMNPTYGLGLKRYLFQYNNQNVIATIRDRLIEQLKWWEPCVEAEKTIVEPGLLFSGDSSTNSDPDINTLKLTVILVTKFGDTLTLEI